MRGIISTLDNAIQDLDPLERYEKLIGSDLIEREIARELLLALQTIDILIEERFFFCGIYLLENNEFYTYALTNNDSISALRISNVLFILQIAGLIYRFTAARRFGFTDTNFKQLRINSWGKEYLNKHYGTEQNLKQALANYSSRAKSIIEKQFDDYSQLINLLKMRIHGPTAVGQLKTILGKLSIRLVQ